MKVYIECSLCRLIRRPEHPIGRHWYLPANWRSLIRCSPDQWVSQCYAIERYRSFYCALFCVFMTRVSQCPISLRSEHPVVLQLLLVTRVIKRWRITYEDTAAPNEILHDHYSIYTFNIMRIKGRGLLVNNIPGLTYEADKDAGIVAEKFDSKLGFQIGDSSIRNKLIALITQLSIIVF
jgi:hypothetical protein